jgi:hypothetical protein
MSDTQVTSASASGPCVGRLLFVADAAVADPAQLPPALNEVLRTAVEVHVATLSMSGGLAWLADDFDQSRHIADERLDTVLGHVRGIAVGAGGAVRRGGVVNVIADAVADDRSDRWS